MLPRCARRRFGALVATAFVVASAPVAGNAAMTLKLEASSFGSGWVAPTKMVPDQRGGRAYDPDDPPWSTSDGRVDYLVTRWNMMVCDGSVASDMAPVVTVTEHDDPSIVGDGLTVGGSVAVQDYHDAGALRPDRIVRYFIADPAYPHGLAAGRHVDLTNADTRDDVHGGGAPYHVSWTAYRRAHNGVCDTAHPTRFDTTIGIDRRLPTARITRPAKPVWPGDARTKICVAPSPPARPVCPLAQAVPAYGVLSGRVVIDGAAQDPLTDPDSSGDDYEHLETSGVAAVVVAVYNNRRRPLKTYVFDNPDCALPYPLDATIRRCSGSMPFSVDVTGLLKAGTRYGIQAYAIDRSGYRSPIRLAGASNSENTNGVPCEAVDFYYAG